jgi:hypothetical protein
LQLFLEIRSKIQQFLQFDFKKMNEFVLEKCSNDLSGLIFYFNTAFIDSSTLCRGELWAGNVMVGLNKDEIGAFVDWQTTMIGEKIYHIDIIY